MQPGQLCPRGLGGGEHNKTALPPKAPNTPPPPLPPKNPAAAKPPVRPKPQVRIQSEIIPFFLPGINMHVLWCGPKQAPPHTVAWKWKCTCDRTLMLTHFALKGKWEACVSGGYPAHIKCIQLCYYITVMNCEWSYLKTSYVPLHLYKPYCSPLATKSLNRL